VGCRCCRFYMYEYMQRNAVSVMLFCNIIILMVVVIVARIGGTAGEDKLIGGRAVSCGDKIT